MSGRRLRQIAGAGASLLALSLAMAGCGSAPQSASNNSSSSAPKTLPTVTIGKAVDTIPFTVVDVAMAEGYFKQNGVNVKEVLVHGSSAANAAMVGGSLQFACQAANPLMLARSRNIPVIAVDALDTGITLQMVVSTKWLKAHPLADNATFNQKMADLNGSVFGEVSTTDLSFEELLRSKAGLPPTSGYQVEQIGTQAAIALAIQKGQIDATIQSPPISIELTQQGAAKDFVDRRDVSDWNNAAYDILTTTTSYAKAHPQITKDVATAIAEALDFMRAHPNQTLAIEQKHFPKLSTAVLQQSIAFIPFAKDGMQSQAGWDNAVSLAQKTGVLKGVTSAPEGTDWTNQYIDTSKLGQ